MRSGSPDRLANIGLAEQEGPVCAHNAYAVVPQIRPRQPDVLMYLGDDETGRPLEVGVVVLDDGDLLVIHVMDMRQKFRDVYIAGHDEIGE